MISPHIGPEAAQSTLATEPQKCLVQVGNDIELETGGRQCSNPTGGTVVV